MRSKRQRLKKVNCVTSSLMVTLSVAPGIKTPGITTLVFITWKESQQTSLLWLPLATLKKNGKLKTEPLNQGKHWWSPQGSHMTLMNPGSAQQHWDSNVRGCRESLNLMALSEGQKGKSGTKTMYGAGVRKNHSCHVRKGINHYSHKWDGRKNTELPKALITLTFLFLTKPIQ